MGTQSAAALTETGPTRLRPDFFISASTSVGVSTWPPPSPKSGCETDLGSGPRCAPFPRTALGFRGLTGWLGQLGFTPDQTRIGMEPTGGWFGRTVAAWLERHGYRVDWLQNFALHDRRKLMIGKQTKTDALDARLIARLLFERERLGLKGGFLLRAPRNTDAVRMPVRNRAR